MAVPFELRLHTMMMLMTHNGDTIYALGVHQGTVLIELHSATGNIIISLDHEIRGKVKSLHWRRRWRDNDDDDEDDEDEIIVPFHPEVPCPREFN